MHRLSYLPLFIENAVGEGMGEEGDGMGMGMGMGRNKLVTWPLGDTSRSEGKTAYCPDILDFKVGAVAGWNLDWSFLGEAYAAQGHSFLLIIVLPCPGVLPHPHWYT